MSAITLVKRTMNTGLNVTRKIDFVAPLLARFVVGFVFILAGWGHLNNMDGTVKYFTELGIPLPAFNAMLASATELVGGALVLVGLGTRLAAGPLIVTMIVAIVTAKMHGNDWLEAPDLKEKLNVLFGWYEFLYIALLVWLGLYGPGKASLDHALFSKWIEPKTDSGERPSKATEVPATTM